MNKWKIAIWAINTLTVNASIKMVSPSIPKSAFIFEIKTTHIAIMTGICMMASVLLSIHKNSGVAVAINK